MCQKYSSNAKNYKGKKLPQYAAALSVCIGSLASGAVIGWTGNMSEDMKSLTYNGIKIDDDSLGWIGSLVTLGMMTSCIPIGKLCDTIGRKAAMLSVTIPFTVGWLLILYANSLAMLYVGRFLTGIAAGAFIVAGPIYTTEIAQKDIRGTLGSYIELFLTIGTLLAYFTPIIVNMKIHTYIVSALPLIFAVLFAFQPESPLFTIQQKREADAKIALIHLRGKNYDVDSELLDMQQIKKTTIIESLKKKGTQKAVIASFGLMFFQAMTGIYPILFYTNTIFESSGSEINTKTATIIIGILQVIGTLVSCLLADRIARRVLLIYSNLFVVISLTMLGLFFTLVERELVNESITLALDFVPLVSLSIYIAMFSLGMGPIPWVINAELFPLEIKGPAMGVTAMFNSLISFITAKIYFDIEESFGGDVNYYIFSIFTFIGIGFIFFYLPETKGKSLDEIQKELNQ